jgi:hypothetical protein
MGRGTQQGRVPVEDPNGIPTDDPAEGRTPKVAPGTDGNLIRPLPSEVLVVPVQAILYLQAMAENGQGDRPKPLGPALPSGYVRYRQ